MQSLNEARLFLPQYQKEQYNKETTITRYDVWCFTNDYISYTNYMIFFISQGVLYILVWHSVPS